MGRASKYGIGLVALFAFLCPFDATPQVIPIAQPVIGNAPHTVAFNAPAGAALYQWQFNYISGGPFTPDYTSDIPGELTWSYENEGIYTARLRMFDAVTGMPSDQDVTITVFPPAVPPVVTVPGGTPQYHAVKRPTTIVATATASPGRTVTTFNWDLDGDGTIDYSSTGAGPSVAPYTYLQTGTYFAKVTAVDSGGLAGSADIEVRVINPPTVNAAPTLPVVRTVPNNFLAVATVDAGRTLVSYAWDFDGDSVVDQLTTTAALSDSPAFAYSSAGVFPVTVTVRDDVGLATTYSFFVFVETDPYSGPMKVTFTDSTGLTVLKVSPVVPGAGKTIVSYGWDLGDGSAPVTTSVDSVTYTYASTATPVTATVTITDSGTPPGQTSESVSFTPGTPPGSGTSPAVVTYDTPLFLAFAGPPFRVGHVEPISPAGVLVDNETTSLEMRYDFDNDGITDSVVQYSYPQGTTSVSTPMTYQFQNPGTQTIKVVANTHGVIAQMSMSYDVLAGIPPLECWITQPSPLSRVWGNHVTVRSRTAPANLTQSVLFRYRPQGSGPWTTIGTASPPPYSSLSVPWNVTGLAPGNYELEAVATDTSAGTAFSSALQQVVVTVDPLTPEQEEMADANGIPTVRVHTIDLNGPSRCEIGKDTAVDFEPHTTTAQYARFRLQRPTLNPHPVEARLQGLVFVPGSFRRLSLEGSGPLSAPAKITLYDTKTDLADALASMGYSAVNAQSAKFAIYQFDTDTQSWVPLFSQMRQPQEDLLRASLVSMGDIGIVVEKSTREGVSASSGGCGLLAPEFLALVLLAGLLRRKRI